MNNPLIVKTNLNIYSIFIEKNSFIKRLTQLLHKNPKRKFSLITDQNLYRIYKELITPLLKKFSKQLHVQIIKSGESQKNHTTKIKIEKQLFKHGFNRDDILIAWGGGVIGDLVGFVAATFMRGISYYAFPTSIISMVDSSIGGKTGIDTPYGKNLIGAFYHPSAVYIDINFIHSLKKTEFINGMAEVIKYHFIADPTIGKDILNNFTKYQNCDLIFLSKIIEKSLLVKKTIVEQDEKESGIRRSLNFGHTIGHAIEHLSKYRIKHGYAIAKGMAIEAYWSYIHKHITLKDLKAIVTYLHQLTFPLHLPNSMNNKNGYEQLYTTCLMDKKSKQQEVYYTALIKIGKIHQNHGEYRRKITQKEFYTSMEQYPTVIDSLTH